MPKRRAMEPRKLPQQRRAKATFDALVTAAAQVLVRDGYEKANVNVIARRAGCSIGSLYQYFPTKEALVAAVLRAHAQRMISVFLERLVELAHAPVRDAIRGVIERTLDAFSVDPHLMKVIVEQVPRTGLLARSRDFEGQLAAMLQGYLEFHRAELKIDNLDLAVKILVHAVDAVMTAMVVESPALEARAALVDELTALIIGYVVKA